VSNPTEQDNAETPDPSPAELSRVQVLLDKALSKQEPVVQRHINRLRGNRPNASPSDIVKRLNAELRAATIGAGVGVGAAAAAPGVGTVAALAISGGETVAFINATALYVLSRASVQDLELRDIEGRRALVMAVMLGDLGSKTVSKFAQRTGQHWAKSLVKNIPQVKINAINRVLGRHFVTKYGTKQGILVLGRVIPFGIGAAIGGAANAVFSQGVIKTADRAFGPAPDLWSRTASRKLDTFEAEVIEGDITTAQTSNDPEPSDPKKA